MRIIKSYRQLGRKYVHTHTQANLKERKKYSHKGKDWDIFVLEKKLFGKDSKKENTL